MISDLEWLLEPPADFRSRLKALRDAIGSAPDAAAHEESLHALASYRLDLNQLGQLAKAAAGWIAQSPAAGPLARAHLGLVGAGTLDLLQAAIVGSALRHRVLATVTLGDYGNAVQDCIDPESPLREADLDLLLIALDHRSIGLDQPQPSADAARQAVEGALATVRAMVAGASASVRGGIMVASVVPPVEPLFGSFDAVEPGTVAAMVAAFNAGLVEMARAQAIVLVDLAGAAAAVGIDRWQDDRQWHLAKLMIGPDVLPYAADIIARTLAAVRGTTRKCLVLDLDNTLWGGVIGDDGVDGIVIGQGSGHGEAFLAIQRMALALRQRGIILAVCSKNDEDVARAPFRDHPDMVLKEDHIAAFVANWGDKATNLRAIAAALNIGLDALVFLDDNPVERAQVRLELPMVAVPEIGDDPALYPRALAAAGYFEAIAFADDDRVRADAYRANAQRAAFAGTSDMAGYLASLEMVADVRGFDAVNRARIAQLINKSNQFNLTTRRYTEREVAALEADPALVTLQVRLVDRFGDNGMICVGILRPAGDDGMEIDTWLMSCRVLGRRMEEAMLAQLVAAAKARGAARLIGRYLPTAKNRMVADHYKKLGFALTESGDDGSSCWSLDLAGWLPAEVPIRIEAA
ncbi:MAG: HAD-IIIC family phosphatase [Sandarakinorhabdus sp.]|nr:HAD-IIIC family phosphatase [Sandarakinorhabdus sp.]